MGHSLNLAILWVPVSKPACPIEGCGIEPVIRVVNGRMRVAGACRHFLRPELFDDKLMLGYADDQEL